MNPPPPAQQEMILTTTPDGMDEIRSKTFVVFLKMECSCVGARGGGGEERFGLTIREAKASMSTEEDG